MGQSAEPIDSSDFESRLDRQIRQIQQAGTAGIGDWVQGATGYRVERTVLTYRNFWMSDSVRSLGCQIAQKDKTLCPLQWAAWMMCVDMAIKPDAVNLFFPSSFRAETAKQRLVPAIAKHFGKPVVCQTSYSLKQQMENAA